MPWASSGGCTVIPSVVHATIHGEELVYSPGAVMGLEMLPYLIPPLAPIPLPLEQLVADEDVLSSGVCS